MRQGKLFFSSHPRSLRFLFIVIPGLLFFSKLKESGWLLPPFPGFTWVVLCLLFVLGVRGGRNRPHLLLAWSVPVAGQIALAYWFPALAVHSLWLLVFQISLFGIWSGWLFFSQPNSRDLYTLWSLSAAIQLAGVPPVPFAKELMGFGGLLLLTLWAMVETGYLSLTGVDGKRERRNR